MRSVISGLRGYAFALVALTTLSLASCTQLQPLPEEVAQSQSALGSLCLASSAADYWQTGPYAVTRQQITLTGYGLPLFANKKFDIFYPTNLNDGCLHPFVAWANGVTISGYEPYEFLNSNLASWGVVVIAAETPSSVSNDEAPFQMAALDYMLDQNQTVGSPFYQKLSTRAGTAGHSMGGAGAMIASQHPNVEAVVGVEPAANRFPKLNTKVLSLGGTDDAIVGLRGPTDSYNGATGPAMLGIYTGATHLTTPMKSGWDAQEPGSIQFRRFYTAWFRCYLADDPTACAMFQGGSSCGVCADPNWATLVTKVPEIHVGKETAGNTNNNHKGAIRATSLTLAQPATLQSLTFLVDVDGGDMRLALYDNDPSTNKPRTLMATTNAFTVAKGWNTQPVVTPVLLPAGTYWLAHQMSTTAIKGTLDGSTGTYCGGTFSYAAMPATFPPCTKISSSYSSFAALWP